MKNFLLLLTLCLLGCTTTPATKTQSQHLSCQQDKGRQVARSIELQKIVKADQDDRENWKDWTQEQVVKVTLRDEARRKRVGEIYGEGCFLKAEDYSAAALVYQHGDAPDHFFQTFIWAKRAVELGDIQQKQLMALGIDRYLVNIGQKQLFGSQATKAGLTSDKSCWCLQQIEKTFPDKRRKEEARRTLADAFNWLKELNQGKTCPNTECEATLKPSPKGTVPGFW